MVAMRILTVLLLVGLSTPALSQPVLTITDARKPNPVASYAYFLEDFTHKLTYEQVSHFPLDSFQALKGKEVVQLAYRRGTVWMRFRVSNLTNADLFLISSSRRYRQLDVFVLDEEGKSTHNRSGYEMTLLNHVVSINPPVIPLGLHPKQVNMQVLTFDSLSDYLHIGDLNQAMVYQRQISRWQNLALGAFLLAFLYALLFFGRLRDPIVGWYALFMFSFIVFYIDFYGFLKEYLKGYINYSSWRRYLPINAFYLLCWSLFHIHFLNLRKYSKTLYWSIIAINAVTWIDYPFSVIGTALTGSYFSFLYKLLIWLGIEWTGYALSVLALLLISLIYVSLQNFRNIYLYIIAFTTSMVSMIISMFAQYGFGWLPYLPYNNLFVPGTLIEIVILGFILGERANEHRRQQTQTQQQLIDQLQENLNQKNKLLQIRDEIARDLHDEVGATLTAIAISTKLVQKKAGPIRTDITPILEQIQTDSQDTIRTLRDTVWALNPDNDAPEKLIERMRTVASQLLINQGIGFTFESELTAGELPAFSMEQRRNIYLVFKEALHNIAKHAQATKADIRISRKADELQIRILDDGQGFDPKQVGEGNGLTNFQKRAAEGGFMVSVCSELGQGTIVEMRIPVRETTHIGG